MDKGYIKTQNNFGFMFQEMDPYGQDFIEFCSTKHSPVLDLGAAYGNMTLKALEKGASVFALDRCHAHLETLEKGLTEGEKARVKLITAIFPEQTTFPKESFHAVHAGLIFHFLTPPEITTGLRRVYDWLKPGGKLFFTACTPYNTSILNFLPVFHARKQSGHPCPGEIQDLSHYMSVDMKDNLPDHSYLFDQETLEDLLERHSFLTKKCGYFTRTCMPEAMAFDGREFIGAIAQKPF